MRVLRGPYREWDLPADATAVTVGVFDGVHRGHQVTLRRLLALAGGRPAVVATFVPHPTAVLAPDHAPRLLTTPEQRMRLFDQFGFDVVAFLEFNDEMRTLPASEFISDVLIGALHAEVVVVGADFRFGYKRQGDVSMLEREASRIGFTFEAIELAGGDAPISSTGIRRLLDEGKLAEAEEWLGRPFSVEGLVVSGEGRGSSMGVSTANLGLDPDQFVPKQGVYGVMVRVRGRRVAGVCNIGIRPTFGGSDETMEVHLLDFSENILGEIIEVEFRHRLRDERKFGSVDELVAQIHMDIEQARVLLAGDG